MISRSFENRQKLKEFLDDNDMGLKTYFDQILTDDTEYLIVDTIDSPSFFDSSNKRSTQTRLNIKVCVDSANVANARKTFKNKFRDSGVIYEIYEQYFKDDEFFELNFVTSFFIEDED